MSTARESRIHALLERKLGHLAPPTRPILKIAPSPEPRVQHGADEGVANARMVRTFRRKLEAFKIYIALVESGLGSGNLNDLSDVELLELRCAVDVARECVQKAASFEDVGLLSSGEF